MYFAQTRGCRICSKSGDPHPNAVDRHRRELPCELPPLCWIVQNRVRDHQRIVDGNFFATLDIERFAERLAGLKIDCKPGIKDACDEMCWRLHTQHALSDNKPCNLTNNVKSAWPGLEMGFD